MSEIRVRATGAVMFESELRQYLKDTGGPSYAVLTPEVMEAVGVDPVLEGPQAQCTPPYQFSQRAGVEQIDGQWFTKYIAGPVFADTEEEAAYKAQKDEEQAKAVRQQRTDKLSETDWRFRTDMNPSQEWKDYCQALRDLPTQAGFPWDIEWPEQPK